MKNSSQSRVRKQVHTQREEYQPTIPVQSSDRRGVSSSSAHAAKNPSVGSNKQRTPIKLLQAKHKHLEIQLAKLSAEVAAQSRENQEARYLAKQNAPHSTANLEYEVHEYDYASPANLHVKNSDSLKDSPSIQQLKQERSGSNNSAKRKKVIKMQQIQQSGINRSQPGLINVHIPGSDLSGKPLASYLVQANVPDPDR